MDLSSTRDFMITNKNLNTMFKPNNIKGQYTTSTGINNDAGISILNGKFNHHTAIVFDIIYDKMYRMFNQMEGMDYIAGSLTKQLSSNDGKRKTYFTKLLTDRKLDFYLKLRTLLNYSKEVNTILYNKRTRDFLLNAAPDIVDNAFPLDLSLRYRHLLERQCEIDGNFDSVINLFETFNLEKQFYRYLLTHIFYGKSPSYNESFPLEINLNSIFDDKERSVYILKDWFNLASELTFNMTYPVTCMSHCFDETKFIPKKLILQSFMDSLPAIQPIPIVDYNKAQMNVTISLTNKFMVYFAHDAKLCVHTYVPSSLYKLNNTAFFIGKSILNNNFYSKGNGYQNKLYYKIDELFNILNLPVKDANNSNNSHRKKSIFKALDQLNDSKIIKINNMTSERVKIDKVWSISDRREEACIEEVIN